jgi:uncharacterized membrane protein YeaQ/YmgE (transglycosylase-associated protein family)
MWPAVSWANVSDWGRAASARRSPSTSRARLPLTVDGRRYRLIMGIIGWILIGLIMGTIAKAVLPGLHEGGWLTTILLGIVGGLVGGFLGNLFFGVGIGHFFSIRTWVLAFVGSIIVLAIWGAIKGRTSTRA